MYAYIDCLDEWYYNIINISYIPVQPSSSASPRTRVVTKITHSYWDITSLYPGEYIDLLASFHWKLLYIRLETTTAKVAYNITTTIPINYKQGYTMPEIVSLLSPSSTLRTGG